MLVGGPPFESSNVQDTINNIKGVLYKMPNLLSAKAQHLIMSVMRLNPADRLTLNGKWTVLLSTTQPFMLFELLISVNVFIQSLFIEYCWSLDSLLVIKYCQSVDTLMVIEYYPVCKLYTGHWKLPVYRLYWSLNNGQYTTARNTTFYCSIFYAMDLLNKLLNKILQN